MKLDATSSTPLYMQLVDTIRHDIESGKFKPSDRIPTEKELSEEYGVSRITVRNALDKLAEEKLLVRMRAKGTFVRSEKISRNVSGMLSFSNICGISGLTPGAKTIKSVIEDATPEDMEQLGLSPDAKIIAIERIRYADGVPVSFEVSRFPERFSFLLQENLNDCSMFDIIRDKYGVVFSHSQKVIEVLFANYQLSCYLNVPRDYPLLSISSLTYDDENQVTHRTHQFIVSDKFKLIV